VIREAVDGICTIYMFALPADFSQVVLGGYIRGIGEEKIGMYSFMICFYGIGLPFAFVLGNILDLEARGLWMGLTIGLYSIFIVNVVIIWRADLRVLMVMIEERITLHGSQVLAVEQKKQVKEDMLEEKLVQ